MKIKSRHILIKKKVFLNNHFKFNKKIILSLAIIIKRNSHFYNKMNNLKMKKIVILIV